jgi:hypothetical protein
MGVRVMLGLVGVAAADGNEADAEADSPALQDACVPAPRGQ